MHTCCASFLNFPCSFERRPSQLFQQSSKQALCSGLSAGLTCGPRAVAGGYPMRNATSTSGIRAGDLGRNLHWAFREQGTWAETETCIGRVWMRQPVSCCSWRLTNNLVSFLFSFHLGNLVSFLFSFHLGAIIKH